MMAGMLSANYLIALWFERRRGLAMGIGATGASVAAIAFPPLATTLIAALGWRGCMLIFGIVTAATAILFTVLIGPPATGMPDTERLHKPAPVRDGGAGVAPSLSLYRRTEIWVIGLTTGVMAGALVSVMVMLVPFAVGIGVGPMKAALCVSVLGGCAFVGKLAFGLGADRLNLVIVLRLAMLAMVVATTGWAFSASYSSILLCAALFGLGLGGMLPLWGALTAHYFAGTQFGPALGVTRMLQTPAALIGPLLVGRIGDMTHDYFFAWIGLAALIGAGLGLTFLVPRRSASPAG
jgi:predicted MFS family arabinose efflux permease